MGSFQITSLTMGFKYLLFLTPLIVAEKCLHPPPAPNYSNALYSGRWYEVGKYQTLGGSIFQQGTVCTIATYDPYDMDVGGGDIGYSSRKQSPSGDFVNATGTLTVVDQPGHFLQELFFFGFAGPSVDYNVVWLDEDTALEYDCNEHILGVIDYCVHFMSRTPTIDPVKLEELKLLISDLGLNTYNLDYKEGDQEGCW